jgi:MtN3 and saliva related transmembrane protein
MNHGYLVEILGMAAAALTTLCWVPQATRILRTRDTRSISLVAQAAFAAGVALWFAYGLMIGSWPVILANAVTLVLALAILAMKIQYR